jgi:hypothetical protein
MKSPQHHTPQMDFLQAALPASASAVARRASCRWVHAKNGPYRVPVGFNRTDPVIVRRAFNVALYGSGAAFLKVA